MNEIYVVNRHVGDLVDEAWDQLDCGNFELANRTVRIALSIQPFTVDAFVILAQTEEIQMIRIAYLQEGVRIGKIVFEGERKSSNVQNLAINSHFLPYMRAVFNLAIELWERNNSDDRKNAIKLLNYHIKMNPKQNRKSRLLAYSWFPIMDRWNDLTKVIHKYRSDDLTDTKYTIALDAWRRGDVKANKYLENAIEKNPHVPLYILAKMKPEPLGKNSAIYSLNGEAHCYATNAYDVWRKVNGAIEWLNSVAR